MANDTVYGLSGYVQGEQEHAQKVARQLRTGKVHINGAGLGPDHAVRRLQAVGQWPRVGRGRHPRVPRNQIGVWFRDCVRADSA